jgi:hypothetical protein
VSVYRIEEYRFLKRYSVQPASGSATFGRNLQLLPTSSSSSCLFAAYFLLGLVIDPDDGHRMSLRNIVNFYRNTQRHIPEGCALHSNRSENSKSCENISRLIRISIEHAPQCAFSLLFYKFGPIRGYP